MINYYNLDLSTNNEHLKIVFFYLIHFDKIKYVFRIFESIDPSDSSNEVHISVSTPPLFDLSFEKTYSGDRTIHIHLDKTRLNVSILFAVELTQFVLDSLPMKRKMTDDNLVSPMISTDERKKYRDERSAIDKKPLNIEKQSGKK